jgi:hypothetical protein
MFRRGNRTTERAPKSLQTGSFGTSHAARVGRNSADVGVIRTRIQRRVLMVMRSAGRCSNRRGRCRRRA